MPCHAEHDDSSVKVWHFATTASSGLAPMQGKPQKPDDVLQVIVSMVPAGHGQHPLFVAGSPQERAHV